MKVAVLLADSGQSDAAGKTHVLGLGWTVTDAPTTTPMTVVVLVSFDDAQDAAGTHEIALRLVGPDGDTVEIPPVDEPVAFTAEVEVQNEIPTAPSTAPFLVNIGPGLPLEPGRRYTWEAVVDGRTEHRAHVTFATRDDPEPL